MAHIAKKSAQATPSASPAEAAAGRAHQAVARLSDAARPTVLRVASGAHQMVDRISGTSSRVAEQLERTASRLKDAEQQLVGTGSRYIRAHPLKATGIALAAGFVVGQLFGWYRAGQAESAEDGVTTAAGKR